MVAARAHPSATHQRWKRPQLVNFSAPQGTKLHSARTLSSLMRLLQWNLHHRHGTLTASLTFQDWQGTGTACTDSCRGFRPGLKSGLSVNFHLMLKCWSWQGDQAAPTTRPLRRQGLLVASQLHVSGEMGNPVPREQLQAVRHFLAKKGTHDQGPEQAVSLQVQQASYWSLFRWTCLQNPDVLPSFSHTPVHSVPDGACSP